MSKSKKQAKLESQELAEARKMTSGKLLRLVLKSMLFALVVSVAMVTLSVLGVPALNTPWVQFGVMLIVYFVAFPFLMSEFRPKGSKNWLGLGAARAKPASSKSVPSAMLKSDAKKKD